MRFHWGDDVVHMAAGEVWVCHPWRTPKVVGPAGDSPIHLVIATVGSPSLWDRAEHPSPPGPTTRVDPGPAVAFPMETINQASVMGPWELRALADEVLAAVDAADPAVVAELTAEVHRFHRQWRAGWALHGDDPSGRESFVRWRDAFATRLRAFDGRIRLRDGLDAADILRHLLARPALDPAASLAARPAALSVDRPTDRPSPPAPEALDRAIDDSGGRPFRSVHTAGFAGVLQNLRGTIAVSTLPGGAGRPSAVRRRQGQRPPAGVPHPDGHGSDIGPVLGRHRSGGSGSSTISPPSRRGPTRPAAPTPASSPAAS